MEKLGGSFQWFLDLKIILPVVVVATTLLTLVATGCALFFVRKKYFFPIVIDRVLIMANHNHNPSNKLYMTQEERAELANHSVYPQEVLKYLQNRKLGFQPRCGVL